MSSEGLEQEMHAKIDHKDLRVILKRDAEEIPPDVEREDKLVDWTNALYHNVMRIAAAGVLAQEGSLEKAASVLWWAGFAVPAGYFPDGHEGDGYMASDEEALRLWVEGEAERIGGVVETWGFYLAASGQLLDKKGRGGRRGVSALGRFPLMAPA